MKSSVAHDRKMLQASILSFARFMIETHGEFYPFAAFINQSGQMEQLGADIGDERPSSKEMIDVLISSLRVWAQDGKLKASGVAFDVRIQVPVRNSASDAIAILFDHVEGTSEQIYIPYRLENAKALFDEPISQPHDSPVFQN